MDEIIEILLQILRVLEDSSTTTEGDYPYDHDHGFFDDVDVKKIRKIEEKLSKLKERGAKS